MNDSSPSAARPSGESRTKAAEDEGGAQRRLNRARRRLENLERRIKNRRSEVEDLRAQISVLGEEAKPLTVRQATPGADTGDLAALETDRGVPSFALAARMHRRHNTTGVHRAHDLREPILDLYTKTAARRFAEEHGVQVPAELGSWRTPDAIEWDSLPDRFVIKSSRGGGGINVFPVERRGEEFYDFIASEMTTREAIEEAFWRKHRSESVYFAEEFLVGRGNATSMPHDIKVFCFYGDPAYIEVRAEDWSRSKGTIQRLRTFLPDGTELFNVRALIPYGEDIDRPDDFQAVADASSRLSAAIRRPIERIDFYETDHGIVFGEITQNPGRPPSLVPEWDRRLGETYEDASARLFADLVADGGLALEYGDKHQPA